MPPLNPLNDEAAMNQRTLLLSLVIGLATPAIALSQTPDVQTSAPAMATQRPASLMPLYVGFATAQALDIHSTQLAIDRGASERNPLLRVFGANNPWAAAVVKAGVTTSAIWSAEQMWRRNRRLSAVVLMTAVTALQVAVDAHNYRVAANLR